MTATTIPWQERIDNFADHVLRSQRGSIFSIRGSIGRGKSRMLRDLAARLADRGSIPVHLSPPRGEEDTAGAALSAAADTLEAHRLLNGQVGTLEDTRVSRELKIGIIVEGMKKAQNSVVLLLDEPTRWVAGEWANDSSTAARRFTLQVLRGLTSGPGCRVVCTGAAFPNGSEPEPCFLPRAWNESDLPAALTENPAWQEVRGRLGGALSEHATPLLCRLVTLLSLLATPEEAAEAARTCIDVADIATLVEKASLARPGLRRAWACFALVRRSIGQALYEQLSVGLSAELRLVAEELLLTRLEGGFALHPVLAQAIDARKALGGDYRAVQQVLARFYLGRKASLADATEAFYHATEAGDDALLSQTRPFFTEQLHLQGRSLSQQRRNREAAEVFRRAVELDPEDDYAHHYRAFNLDRIAEDLATVEGEYGEAIRLNPSHPWWHSRLINYYITVGRTADARTAFANATDSLQDAIASHPEYVYRSLHSWVAALLLHRGQLEFARKVLDRVPERLRREHRGFIALGEKLAALEEARRGRGVFPLSVPASEHWRKAPHLDFPPQVEGKQLLGWHPARVDAVSAESLTLIVGKPPEGGATPTYGRVELPRERFEAATLGEPSAGLRPGRFLELAFYGEEGLLRIQAYPDTPWQDPDLPYLDPPDTLRYLRHQEHQS